MTGAPQLPPELEAAHRAIAQKAAQRLGSWIDGNGLKAEQARLSRDDIKIHRIPGDITVKLTPVVARKQLQGQHPQGTVLGSESEVSVQANGLIHDMLAGDDTQKSVMTALEKVPGHGFGMKGLTVALSGTRKDFSVVAQCVRCQGSAASTCPQCHGGGAENCQNCRGEGTTPCQVCFGVGMVQDASGVRTPCARCLQKGRLPCVTCQGQRTIPCSLCNGQCRVPCNECGRTGHSTTLYQVSYKAQCEFDVIWKDVEPEARQAAEKLGLPALATEKLASIFWQLPEVSGDSLHIPCMAFLPVADAEFSVVGKKYPAVVAGLQGRIIKIDPVLDPVVKPGIGALMKLSRGPMAVQALIDTACKYKMIRQVLAGLMQGTTRKVYQALVRDYPAVLSDKYACATVMYAEKALLAITAAPRYKGLALGTILSAVPIAVYCHTPLRRTIETAAGPHIVLADLAVWLAGWVLTVFLIKTTAASAFRKLLPQSVKVGRAAAPPAGSQGWMALGTVAVVWIAVAAVAAQKPDWLLKIFAAVGLTL